jgi:hypothetical protein
MPPIIKDADADAAVRRAHAAFRSTADRRLRSLHAHGIEGGAASSQLLDDLITPHNLTDQPGKAGAWHTSPSSSSGGGGGGGGSGGPVQLSLQHVVASTGASPAQASQILQLREEISRLRRDGHSTATLIEQLRGRLRGMGESRAGWGDEDAENAEAMGARRDKAGGASKKRRVGDESISFSPGHDAYLPGENECPHDATDLTHHQATCSGPHSPTPYSPGLHHEHGELGGGTGGAMASEKRHREERDAAPLAQLKKLKLRAQLEG